MKAFHSTLQVQVFIELDDCVKELTEEIEEEAGGVAIDRMVDLGFDPEEWNHGYTRLIGCNMLMITFNSKEPLS